MKKIITNKIIIFIIGLFLSILLNFLIASIGAYSNSLKIIIGSVTYFCVSYLIQNKNLSINKYQKLSILIFPIIFIQLLANIIDYNSTINSLPVHLSFLLSCILGYFFFYKKNLIIPFGLLSIIIFYFLIGEKWYHNYRYYQALDLSANAKLPNFKLFDKNGVELMWPLNKFIILDFWNSKCAPCFKEFPFIDSISKTIDTANYHLAVVNVPTLNETKVSNYNLLQSYNYTFNKYFSENESILDSLKISYYPTTIVIKNKRVIYKGDFRTILEKLKVTP